MLKRVAADLRKSRVHPTVKKLTAWRKANRLSQPKAVAVLGQYYFHITFGICMLLGWSIFWGDLRSDGRTEMFQVFRSFEKATYVKLAFWNAGR
jgi:hypothetical protein